MNGQFPFLLFLCAIELFYELESVPKVFCMLYLLLVPDSGLGSLDQKLVMVLVFRIQKDVMTSHCCSVSVCPSCYLRAGSLELFCMRKILVAIR